MPRYYCDYCDTYLTHDSPSVRKQHNSGYKHKANIRSYYQKFEEQQTQILIDQRIKEHIGQAAVYQQIGAAYNQHLASFPGGRPRLPIMPPPMLPIPGAVGIRPVLPMPVPGAPVYGAPQFVAPMTLQPATTSSFSLQSNGVSMPRPMIISPIPGGPPPPSSNNPPYASTQSTYNYEVTSTGAAADPATASTSGSSYAQSS